MLPRPAASVPPSIYQRLVQQQSAGLLIRFLGIILLSWALGWEMIPFGQWHLEALQNWLFEPFTLLLLSYSVIHLSLFFTQIFWADKRWLFIAGSIFDGLFAAILLALYPGVALAGFAISVAALLAMFQGLSGRFILVMSLILSMCALIVGHLTDNLVNSAPVPVNGIQALFVVFALLAAWRFEKMTLGKPNIESDIDPISRLPRVKALHTSLHYLLPYHQRNKIPISLLMIGFKGRVKHPPTMQSFVTHILERIRHSDVLVHLDDGDFVILLCDTPVTGASILAKDLSRRLTNATTLELTFAVSSVALDNAAIDPLLIRMRDAVEQARHQKTDRIIFVTEERLESISN
ncbi:MAG: hypothetical protein NVS3B3_10740 [Aquirhabdus sp.]